MNEKIFSESRGMYSDKTAIALDNINKFIECLERKVLNGDENHFMSVQ